MTSQRETRLSDLAIAPGETLRETLAAIDLSQAELARRMGRPQKTVNEIINGKAQITPETAIQLERVLGIPSSIWNSLETLYRQTLAAQQAELQLSDELAHVSAFPYAEMAKHKWVKACTSKRERARELLDFFRVASLAALPRFQAAYRVSKPDSVSADALAAWLRQGEREAEKIKTGTFDSYALKSFLPSIRRMTKQSPKEFVGPLVGGAAACGVAIVVVPHLPKTYANGAARWLSPTRAIVQLSLRTSWADVFWFTLFHELGHLLLHGRGEFVDYDKPDGAVDGREAEANEFAAETLMPRAAYDGFVRGGFLTAERIVQFAGNMGVCPGIVVGRLQRQKLIPFNRFNGLRPRFKWVS